MKAKMKRLGVIFGGMSTENEVSVQSAFSILQNLDKEKYDIFPIYIEKDGNWYEYKGNFEKVEFGGTLKDIYEIPDVMKYLKELDVVFPVLHGLYGEDGTIQGLLELLKIPYVGCGVLASSIGMDKVYTKIIFEKVGINQAKYEFVKKVNKDYVYVDKQFQEKQMELKDIVELISENLKFPVFVKPSRSGSSVGVKKAKDKKELSENIEYASRFDSKILIEEGIIGKEVECAVFGKDEVMASRVGEIKSAEEFYSFDAKYINEESRTQIPANISTEKEDEIRKLAIKAFKAIDGKGLSRVDFFVEEGTQKVYINEINTLPGFTSISMYPKMMEASGIPVKELLDSLIELC